MTALKLFVVFCHWTLFDYWVRGVGNYRKLPKSTEGSPLVTREDLFDHIFQHQYCSFTDSENLLSYTQSKYTKFHLKNHLI